MAEQLVVRELTSETRPVVERLWQLYRHDLSEFRGTHAASGFRGTLPGEDGTYNVRGLAPFLAADSARRAYLFYSGSSPVGLAFVALSGGRWVMHEFFVVRGARRRGFGYAAVRELFALHPGEWDIAFQESNAAAGRFWRGVASAVAADSWHEERRPVPGKPDVPPDVWLTFRAG